MSQDQLRERSPLRQRSPLRVVVASRKDVLRDTVSEAVACRNGFASLNRLAKQRVAGPNYVRSRPLGSW